ncbi:VirB5-like protein [Moraxella macacae 0408225]|uniref:VirB5-like protein n=1 Tax=Moraxella macacae 0408225 TaxID=1230338 RepID=L2F9W1_9GAMM|nr:VirB5-like protein [Moraxella macacae]ELA09258.1 VirB5-like protein [Moraxella macacae 0408225]
MRNKTKQIISAITLIFSITSQSAYSAALPVIDPAAIAQAVKQVYNQIQQLEQMRNQLKAMTGNSGLGAMLSDPTLRKMLNQYLPKGKGYHDIMEAVKRGDAGALQSIYEQVLANEQNKRSQMTGKERLAMTMALNEAQLIGAIKTLDLRANNAQNLVNQINRTTDTSSKADLMNTLSAEASLIQIDLARFQVMIEQGKQQKERAEQQAIDEFNEKRRR